MMTPMRATILCVSALTASALALDLRPIEATRELEGIQIPVLRFRDTGRVGQWQLPTGWTYQFEGERLRLDTKSASGLFAEFRVIARDAKEVAGDEKALAQYAAGLLPPSVNKPEFTAAFPSPFTLGTIQTTEFAFKATEFARPVRASIILAELSATQRLCVMIIARDADFPAMRDALVSSLAGWNWETSAEAVSK